MFCAGTTLTGNGCKNRTSALRHYCHRHQTQRLAVKTCDWCAAEILSMVDQHTMCMNCRSLWNIADCEVCKHVVERNEHDRCVHCEEDYIANAPICRGCFRIWDEDIDLTLPDGTLYHIDCALGIPDSVLENLLVVPSIHPA